MVLKRLFVFLLCVLVFIWFVSVKFEVGGLYGVSGGLRVSGLTGNMFLGKLGYWSKLRVVKVNLTSEPQKGFWLVDGDTEALISSASVELSGRKLEIWIHYDEKIWPEIKKDTDRLSRDLMFYICSAVNSNLLPEECDLKVNSFKDWTEKVKLSRIVTMNKLRSISFVRNVYAGCYGVINCGAVTTTCTCSFSSVYNYQCINSTSKCGPLGSKIYACNCSSGCSNTGNSLNCSSIDSSLICESQNPAMCDVGQCNLLDYPCDWCTPTASWSSWSSCYYHSGLNSCIKDRACISTCGGTCSGDTYAYCTAADKNCVNQNCPTDCDYPGGWVGSGTLNADCSCGTKWCSATAACCTPVNGVWSAWSAWGACGASCTQTSTRTCTTVASCGGTGCTVLGAQETKTQTCGPTAPSGLVVNFSSATNARIDWTPGTGGTRQMLRVGANTTEVNTGCPGINTPYCVIKENNLSTITSTFSSGGFSPTTPTYLWRVVNYDDISTCYQNAYCTTVCSAPLCGQANGCNGVCPNSDDGVPEIPVQDGPGTTSSASPEEITDTTPTLSWRSVPLADRYRVQLFNYNTGATIIDSTIAGTSITSGVLGPGVYRWRVRAENTTCGTDVGTMSSYLYFTYCSPINGVWGAWGSWGVCNTLTCLQSSSRTCITAAECGGTGCTVVGIGETRVQACGLVDGGWSAWAACTPPFCGQLTTRTCTDPAPLCGGASCVGVGSTVCANTDDGMPIAPTIVWPNGTQFSPTIISTQTPTLEWNAVLALADQYNVEVYNVTTGALVWSTTTATTTATTGSLVDGVLYRWRVRGVNTTCGIDPGLWSVYGYFQINLNEAPVITSVVITNLVGSTLVAEAGSRNHICQTLIYDSATPRGVRFIVNATDGDGGADINSMTLSWNGNNYVLALQPPIGNSRSGIVDVTFGSGANNGGVFPLVAIATDLSAASDTDNSRNWKVWDCLVPVSGTVYNGSAGQACNDTGFSIPAGAEMGFSRLNFGIGGAENTEIEVAPPATFGGPTSKVVWARDYLPLFNGGDNTNINGSLAAAGRFTRYIDLGTGTTICPGGGVQVDIEANISAYSASPRAQVDFSFIQDQEPWFQLRGGEIRSIVQVSSGVPVTALNATLVTDGVGIGTPNAGMVASDSFRNTNGNTSTTQYGFPNNWWIKHKLLGEERYGYGQFYSDYFVTLGEGKTGVTAVNDGDTGVLFVNGNLNISNDVRVNANQFLMVIVRGTITVEQTVNRLDGIYVADGTIGVVGNSATQLVINGMMYSQNSIRILRSYTDPVMNNISPAVVVNFRPDLIFSIPGNLVKVLSGWREY